MNLVKTLNYNAVVTRKNGDNHKNADYGRIIKRPQESPGYCRVQWFHEGGNLLGSSLEKIGYWDQYDLVYAPEVGKEEGKEGYMKDSANIQDLRMEVLGLSNNTSNGKTNTGGNSSSSNYSSNLCSETISKQRSESSSGSPIQGRRRKFTTVQGHFRD